jgi:hypothetical protein
VVVVLELAVIVASDIAVMPVLVLMWWLADHRVCLPTN